MPHPVQPCWNIIHRGQLCPPRTTRSVEGLVSDASEKHASPPKCSVHTRIKCSALHHSVISFGTARRCNQSKLAVARRAAQGVKNAKGKVHIALAVMREVQQRIWAERKVVARVNDHAIPRAHTCTEDTLKNVRETQRTHATFDGRENEYR